MDSLHRIVSEVFDIKERDVREGMGPADIREWDSLGQLKLITAIETHYKIKLDIAEIFEIFTISDIKKILAKRGIS